MKVTKSPADLQVKIHFISIAFIKPAAQFQVFIIQRFSKPIFKNEN